MNKKYYFLFLILIISINFSSLAFIYSLPFNKNNIVGKISTIFIPHNNKLPLEFFAEKYQIGLSNIIESNSYVDIYLPKSGTKIIIPNKLILPEAPRIGIIINIAEMRLFYYPANTKKVVVFPIGIGEIQHSTPSNWITKIIRKKKNPVWIPTKEMHEEYKKQGIILPKIVPAGKNNPMGLYAMYIGNMYAIHGTNADFGIGLRISHGCIRLRNNDIKWLFNKVPIGTRVQFVNQAIKASIESDGSIFLEVHQPLSDDKNFYSKNNELLPLYFSPYIKKILNNKMIDKKKLEIVFKEKKGIPTQIN